MTISVFSCKEENSCDCIKSTGSIQKEIRTSSTFNKIIIDKNVNLFLTQDTINSIEVEAGENLLSLIKTTFEENSLKITNSNKCNWVRSFEPKVNVYVHFIQLNHIEMNGSGDVITTNTIKTDTLYLEQMSASGKADLIVDAKQTYFKLHTGPGDLNVVGKTDGNYIYSSGNGFVHCENLVNNLTIIDSRSTGDCYITATNQIEANIGHIGNIYYYGNPPLIHATITGTGVFEKK